MAFILDSTWEIVALVRSNLYYSIVVRPLILSRAVTDRIVFFSLKRPVFLHACATCSELPSNISTMLSAFMENISGSISVQSVYEYYIQYNIIHWLRVGADITFPTGGSRIKLTRVSASKVFHGVLKKLTVSLKLNYKVFKVGSLLQKSWLIP